ncbi:MAG: von Willebrand factor type A domain-containing protein [Hydrotalea sp.]|nr:von Willebrand factor type A domain-containing protein [Hydrotalea sp.]
MQRIYLSWILILTMLFSFKSTSEFLVQGNIENEFGQPIIGATIHAVGSKLSVKSNEKGYFKIIVTGKRAQLSISAKGYTSKIVDVIDQRPLRIQLKNEVVANKFLQEATTMHDGLRLASAEQASASSRRSLDGHPTFESAPFMRRRGSTDVFETVNEQRFQKAQQVPLSTFSIDVDVASYAVMRRFLEMRQWPVAGSVRIEEMLNYFPYNYPQTQSIHPMAIHSEIANAPWNDQHYIVKLALQAKQLSTNELPPSHFVFLVDVSGSMMPANRLPLVKEGLLMLVEQLREQDRISIVVYASGTGVVLPSTSGYQKELIRKAINSLQAGGQTAGASGIQLAYKLAQENYVENGNNRVILCTDGDFNVGVSSDAALEKMIEQKRSTGIYLSVLGFGMGNYKDARLQKLSAKGNGNYAYIDSPSEAKKVLVKEFGGTLYAVAKDVKVQVEFNPQLVQAYRLIGYENRHLDTEDFEDDSVDAGEMGSGHTVTAIYEIIPVGIESSFVTENVNRKYTQTTTSTNKKTSQEWLTVQVRYQPIQGGASKLLQQTLQGKPKPIQQASENMRYASAVAEIGLLLMESPYRSNASFQQAINRIHAAKGIDEGGYRAEFLKLAKMAWGIAQQRQQKEDWSQQW